jgi:hypothetical protein
MVLAAFTNEGGYHQRSDLAQGEQSGTSYGNPVHEIVYDVPYVMAYAQKPSSPTRSNHRLPTDWFRAVGEVVVNEPATRQRRVHEGDGTERHTVIDLVVTEHISNSYAAFSYGPEVPGSDEAHNSALTRAKLRLHEHNSSWGENLGQGKKSCEDLAKKAASFAKALAALKRKNVREAARHLGIGSRGKPFGSVADFWLASQFVIQPTLSDIHELNEAAIEALKKKHPFSVSATAETASDYRFVYEFRDCHAGGKVSFRAQLNGFMMNTGSYLLESAGLVNPLEIAWELLPWSFVVDWFIPVGNTLEAMTAGYGLNDNGGWITMKKDTFLHIQHFVDYDDGSDGYRRISPGEYTELQYAFNRYCFIAWPEWTGFYTAPNPFSSAHGLNAMALLRQLL